ncbi:MAG TPA: DUF1573 domain-containing protein [Thermoanaerobaculia bacterium]
MRGYNKTVILALCAALLVAGAVLAQGKPKAVAVEPIKDMGTVPKGEKIIHDFQIRNDGDAPLEITNVRPACGCTVAEYDKVIAPGKTGKVHAEIDTVTFNGAIAKGVSVFTNDPATPEMELTVRAKVEPYIAVKPGYARYITVQGEPQEGTIPQTIWVPDGSSMEITKVESPWPFLDVKYREAKPEERVTDPTAKGKQWRIEMTLSNNAKVGALSDYVTIHTNHPKQKVVQIPVSGFVRPVVAATPQAMDFGQVDLKEPKKRSINVRNFATEPIKVTGIEQTVKGVEAQVEPLEDGREYQVRVTLTPGMPKGPFNGKLMIKTDSPKAPTIEVDLKGIVL